MLNVGLVKRSPTYEAKKNGRIVDTPISFLPAIT